MSGKYSNILTTEFLQAHSEFTPEEIADIVGCSVRTVFYYKSRLLKDNVKMLKPDYIHVKPDFDFDTFEEYVNKFVGIQKVANDSTNSKQKIVRYKIDTEDEWIALAIIGDLHIGCLEQDISFVNKMTKLIESTKNCVAVQLGDVVEAQASMNHRSMNRTAPKELPMRVQRKAAVKWAESIAKSLIAIIYGNHDHRAVVTEDYDICEDISDIIDGAYLGSSGIIELYNENVSYKTYISHYGSGYSQFNPLHPAMRMIKDNPGMNLDIACIGHVHGGSAVMHYPHGKDEDAMGKEFVLIRTAGFEMDLTDYAEYRDLPLFKPSIPVVLLNTKNKQMIAIKYLEYGLKMLKLLNEE